MSEPGAEGAALEPTIAAAGTIDEKQAAAEAHAAYVIERADAAVEGCTTKVEKAKASLAAAEDALANATAERAGLEN